MTTSHTKMVPAVVFDISSSSVAGAHILIPKGIDAPTTKVSILASTRIYSEPKEDITIERFVDNTLSTITSVATTLKKADAHRPEHLYVLLASPWFVSQTRTITYSKETEFTCTEKMVEGLIEKEIAFIVEHDMGRFGSMGNEGIIIEKQLSLITLNGYSTANPYGKKATSLELFLVVTVAPNSIISRMRETLDKEYPHTPLSFTTSPYATHIVTRDFISAPSESILIDIGEEITDIACIKDELFLYHQSFPIGTYHFYRTLSAQGHTSIAEARATTELFKLGKLSASMTSTVQKSLEEFLETWKRALKESIDASTYSLKLPSTIYSTTDDVFSSFFNQALQYDPFISHAVGEQTYSATTLTYEVFSTHISSLDPSRIDETIIIGALFASRLI